MVYPVYTYYPRWQASPPWVPDMAKVFAGCQGLIDTATNGNVSDAVLRLLRPGLIELGFEVEAGKTRESKLARPVFFGENGEPERQYQIDAYHPAHPLALEVEAGPSTAGQPLFRDLLQKCVPADVDHPRLALPLTLPDPAAIPTAT